MTPENRERALIADMHRDLLQRVGQTKTAISHVQTNMDLVLKTISRGEIPDAGLLRGLIYASKILAQAVECLEGKRDWIVVEETSQNLADLASQCCDEIEGTCFSPNQIPPKFNTEKAQQVIENYLRQKG